MLIKLWGVVRIGGWLAHEILLGQELDNYWNSTSILPWWPDPEPLSAHSQYWQSDRGSLLGAGPLLTTFVCVHHKLSAYQLCSLSVQEISGKVEFKYWPRASSCGQWPVSLTSSSADRISAVCETIILIWDKVVRKWQTLSTLLDIFFLLFL